ncbi:MAG: DinB family protein [Psychroflexus sp.]
MLKKYNIQSEEYKPYYDTYLKLVSDNTTLDSALESYFSLIHFYEMLPEEKLMHRYQPEKWTPKQIFQHLIDTERVFSYRALRFARNDFSELSGFNENEYAENCNANNRSLKSLIEEYKHLRLSNISMYESFSDEVLKNKGQASGGYFSVRVIPFILKGHERHHMNVIESRYL